LTFQAVPVNFVGQSYAHRSRSLSSQVTMNMIPEFVPTGKTEAAMTSWPGSKSFSTAGGVDRGMHVFAKELYKVTTNTLFKIDLVGKQTNLGFIQGNKPCIFADNGTTMRIATGSQDYLVTADVLTELTDSDLKPGNSVTFLNNLMINDSDGGQFQVSDFGVPGSIAPNNFATAESAPDDTIRVYAFNERIFPFGDVSTVETWYNSGTGNPPVDRVQGGTMQIGLAAVYSVANSTDFVYFLGTDRTVYRFSGTQPQPATPPAIAAEFQSYDVSDDARASVANIEGMYFYIISFPTEGKTWAFNETGNAWFQLSTGADENQYIGTSYAEAYGKKLIADGGNVLELDVDTFTDNGQVIINERVSPPIVSPTGNRIEMSSFTVIMETGVGLITGQGEKPQAMFYASLDGGKSFDPMGSVELGRQGEAREKVTVYYMASAYEIIIKMRVSDPVFISIHGASIELREAGF